MELSRQEYPSLLQHLSPLQAVSVLNDRMKHFEKLNDDISDWLQERRKVEEMYVQGLRRLSRKTPPSEESSDMGIFAQPWQRIVGATESLADSHSNLAKKIESDVEKPLRDFVTSNREMQAMPNMQGNLQALAKEHDAASRKSERLRDRGQKAASNKVATASSDLENAEGQWQSQAPFVFETLQALDESRCNQLRDVLTQFQTHEVDQVERSRRSAESCLNSLLSIETADEIKTFAIRQQGGGRRGSYRPPSLPNQQSQGSRSSNLAPPPAAATTDDTSDRRSVSPSDEPIEKKGGIRGLRRLGTVMSRRKSSTTQRQSMRPSREDSARSRDSIPSTTQGTPSRGIIPPVIEEASSPTSPTRSRPPRQERPNTSEQVAAPIMTQAPNLVNGTSQPQVTPQIIEPLQPEVSSKPPQIEDPVRDAEGFSVPVSTIDPITQAEQEAASTATEPQFKMAIRDAPIEENRDADAAMANMANTLRAQAAPPKRNSTVRGRRDVRNTVFVPSDAGTGTQLGPGPTAQLEQTAPQVQPSVRSTPAAQSDTVVSPIAVPTVSPLAAIVGESAQPAVAPQTGGSMSQVAPGEDRGGSDTQSLRSLTSLGSTVPALKHPEMRQPGLNSSIMETVSAWFEKGEVSRATLIGEMALQFNAAGASSSTGTERIRLENFATLEKVASNPAFINQSNSNPGEYELNVTGLTNPNVAFKYQAHLDERTFSKYAPLLLSPSWKVEPSQTSVILNYTLNPAFDSSSTVTLNNTFLAVYLDTQGGSGKPLSCQSKPAGTFSRERSLIYWHLPELVLSPGAPPQRLIARFATDGQATPGRVEARFELNGRSGSNLGISVAAEGGTDPFADEGAVPKQASWKEVDSLRKLGTGTYQATA